jgi:hypothetical protein
MINESLFSFFPFLFDSRIHISISHNSISAKWEVSLSLPAGLDFMSQANCGIPQADDTNPSSGSP